MITSFKNYINEDNKTIYFTFGRLNPPTIGHEKLFDKLAENSGKSSYRIYLSHTSGSKTKSGVNKDPLVYESKIKYSRKAFPKHARSIVKSENVKTPFDALVELYNEGFTNVVMMVGSDRLEEFNNRLNLYNGKEGRHGFYLFENGIEVISAGFRDIDSDGVDGASSTKLREYANDGDFRTFSQYLPEGLNNTEAKKLFNEVRVGLGLKEQTEFKRHVQLEPVSEEREEFVKGNLFQIGDEVVIKETSEIGTIEVLGANYVIVESNGNRYRKWLEDVELVEDGQPDWGTPESTKKAVDMTPGQKDPNKILKVYKNLKRKSLKDKVGDVVSEQEKYHRGLSKSTISKRKAHFEKGKKMDDDNPKAYEPAPGDKRAETKPSKHTLKYRRMYGEKLEESSKSGLKKKAEESGISYSILKDVYDRGVAAWRTGHRPGTTPSQWGYARVNSFITGGKTRRTADKDLWKKHKGNKND
jgi:hypothetical protein